ncbi:MAG: cytochrome c [Acidimicrobiales bacterium]
MASSNARAARHLPLPFAFLIAAVLVVAGAGFGGVSFAAATEAPADTGDGVPAADDEAQIELLTRGAAVYSSTCSGCHQPGGVGLPSQFPPLLDNPNVQDEVYLRDVLANGRQGELVVNGVTYNGRMPAFSTLPADDVDAVIAYVQGGFLAPAAPTAAAETGGSTGSGLPDGANLAMQISFLIAGAVGLFVLLPRITSAHDGLEMPWLDASLKTAIIVVGFIAFTVFVPNWALQTDTVNKLDRPVQEFVGTSLWLGGLLVTLGAVWYAHREKRI